MRGMILAAGLGTRLRPFTEIQPKPALPLLNVPLGHWPLYHLLRAGVRDLVVNTHHLPQEVEEVFRYQTRHLRALNFTRETPAILGSAGGIANARKFLDNGESFWVANGDEVFLPTDPSIFESAKSLHARNSALATLVVMKHGEVGSKFGGVWVDREGQVRGFGKTPPAEGLIGYHYTGFQILSPEIFKFIPEGKESNIFYDVLVRAISEGHRVQVVTVWGDWFETGNIVDLVETTKFLLQALPAHELLQKILRFYLGENGYSLGFQNGASVFKAPTAQLDPKVGVSGFLVLGENAKVESNTNDLNQRTRLHNVIVGAGCHVPSGQRLSDTLVIT